MRIDDWFALHDAHYHPESAAVKVAYDHPGADVVRTCPVSRLGKPGRQHRWHPLPFATFGAVRGGT